ncbi:MULTISPECIES: DEAD/DEAH box helicase [Clostridia]|uniref:DEAD/DEAH box helicase n=1 Tax=Clostridia TaxID=186801 RepID=UPI000EA1577F|nr:MULTISPECIES: DEAD/DEAH box helicase [Clostridia]NBJ68933.1 DNA helicase [Roseburia sp. 1XD42-34]RKI79838.1 DNA helicase [Clostridium sp. 1xD42-85]
MRKEDVKSVLEAWKLVESLSPSKVNSIGKVISKNHFADEKKRRKTEQISLSDKPWEQVKLKESSKEKLQFRYYLGCFQQYKLVEYLRYLLQNNEKLINKDKTILFSFSFSIDQNGEYIKDSIFVPILMYATRIMSEKAHIAYDELKTAFDDKLQLFEDKVDAIFKGGVDEHSLYKALNTYRQYFFLLENQSLHYVEKEIIKEGSSGQSSFNSFFLKDLENIIQKGTNETLYKFIEGVDSNNRIIIDENRKVIEEILQPKYLPNGRWPSKVEHRLTLMQQVAVNQIINMNEKVHSVNGPPGTGKTTLLKDIFAHTMVERAEAMIKLGDPKKAFQKLKTLQLEGYNYPIYEMENSIRNYSMVVASSNNGAVENISKDLPKEGEVIRKVNEKDKFKAFEELYADEVKQLNMYPIAAKELMGNDEKAWGLFSAAMGKKENISSYYNKLYNKDEDSFINQLEQDSKNIDMSNWKDAVNDFQATLRSIKAKKKELQFLCEQLKDIDKLPRALDRLETTLIFIEEEKKRVEETLEHYQERKTLLEEEFETASREGLLKRVIRKVLRKKNEQILQLEAELVEINAKIQKELDDLHQLNLKKYATQEVMKEEKNKIDYYDRVMEKYENQNLVLPDEKYWSSSVYDYRQEKAIWITDELNYERGLLFLKAMKIHKLILIFNYKAIRSNLRLLNYRNQLDLNQSEHRRYLEYAWQAIHLITPLISTTFASFSLMYKGVSKDFIDYLFIDEAGQASPQQAAGALWRSKNAIVVGDPLQIEPVVTIDQTILGDIKKYYNVDSIYIDKGSSVQSIADNANRFGVYNKYRQWIGIPLWVHRRCSSPMFTISNEIAYDNKMVLAKEQKIGESAWFHCIGSASNRQFVKEQAYFVAEKIASQWKNGIERPDIYVITPFTAVKDGIKNIVRARLKQEGIPNRDISSWIIKSIGTVHTFQGREADIVYFVAGTDEKSDSAADWSCSKPNLINVAVTRAKKEFYMIGDYNRLSKKEYYKTIAGNIGEVYNLENSRYVIKK